MASYPCPEYRSLPSTTAHLCSVNLCPSPPPYHTAADASRFCPEQTLVGAAGDFGPFVWGACRRVVYIPHGPTGGRQREPSVSGLLGGSSQRAAVRGGYRTARWLLGSSSSVTGLSIFTSKNVLLGRTLRSNFEGRPWSGRSYGAQMRGVRLKTSRGLMFTKVETQSS